MRNGNVTLRGELASQTSYTYPGGPDASGPVTMGARAPYKFESATPMTTTAITFTTPLSGCVIFAKSEFCSMFNTTMLPKMNGTVARVKKIIGSMPIDTTPIWSAMAAPTRITTVQTSPSTGCFITPGTVVRGHKSKQSTMTTPASPGTKRTGPVTPLNMPCGADCR